MTRISVSKTYKMYINGAYVRSERAYVGAQHMPNGTLIAHYPTASRKDLRDAVSAARKAQSGWAKRAAFNRSQIIFRIAEMLETRRAGFEANLTAWLGYTKPIAKAELDTAIDAVFWYAGWADKYTQVLGSINPVAAPFFNYSVPEPTGVVVQFVPASSPVAGLLRAVCIGIVTGNTVVVIADNIAPLIALDLAEVLGVSDVPAGVVNLLTGNRKELLKPAAQHMDVNAIGYWGDDAEDRKVAQEAAAGNMKRLYLGDDAGAESWRSTEPLTLYDLLPFVEFKTVWHPVGV